jgi:hypothetical protein
MLNIQKITNGFFMRECEYLLQGEAELIDETQAHVFTDKGIILLDTSVTINEKSFATIELFINYLYE